VDVFLPNASELKAICGTDSVDAAAGRLSCLVKNLVVKLGTKGSIAISAGKKYFVSAYLKNETVEAIGAGDKFDAGFIVKYISGSPVESCLRFGNLMGAINTTAAGGTAAFSSRERIKTAAREKFSVEVFNEITT